MRVRAEHRLAGDVHAKALRHSLKLITSFADSIAVTRWGALEQQVSWPPSIIWHPTPNMALQAAFLQCMALPVPSLLHKLMLHNVQCIPEYLLSVDDR